MPAAAAETAATFAGIHNENEFYSHHYLSEVFAGDIRETVERWREAAAGTPPGTATPSDPGNATDPASTKDTSADTTAAHARIPYGAPRALAPEYVCFRREFERERRTERRLELQRGWFRRLLAALGFGGDWKPGNHLLEDGVEALVLCAAGFTAGAGIRTGGIGGADLRTTATRTGDTSTASPDTAGASTSASAAGIRTTATRASGARTVTRTTARTAATRAATVRTTHTAAPQLLVIGVLDAHARGEAEGEDPLSLKPHRLQFHGEVPPPETLLRET